MRLFTLLAVLSVAVGQDSPFSMAVLTLSSDNMNYDTACCDDPRCCTVYADYNTSVVAAADTPATDLPLPTLAEVALYTQSVQLEMGLSGFTVGTFVQGPQLAVRKTLSRVFQIHWAYIYISSVTAGRRRRLNENDRGGGGGRINFRVEIRCPRASAMPGLTRASEVTISAKITSMGSQKKAPDLWVVLSLAMQRQGVTTTFQLTKLPAEKPMEAKPPPVHMTAAQLTTSAIFQTAATVAPTVVATAAGGSTYFSRTFFSRTFFSRTFSRYFSR
jgi:hypothetical protein